MILSPALVGDAVLIIAKEVLLLFPGEDRTADFACFAVGHLADSNRY